MRRTNITITPTITWQRTERFFFSCTYEQMQIYICGRENEDIYNHMYMCSLITCLSEDAEEEKSFNKPGVTELVPAYSEWLLLVQQWTCVY